MSQHVFEPAQTTIVSAQALRLRAKGYAELLERSVGEGASIGFVQPFSVGDAETFWLNRIAPSVESGSTILFEALIDDRVAGTVQLLLPTMPNQPHKADVSKMMVHPDFRRRGIAKSLMQALIDEAVRRGFKILTLDTRTGDKAQPLYAAFGFDVAGEIPGFAVDPDDPSKLDGTTYMYKWL